MALRRNQPISCCWRDRERALLVSLDCETGSEKRKLVEGIVPFVGCHLSHRRESCSTESVNECFVATTGVYLSRVGWGGVATDQGPLPRYVLQRLIGWCSHSYCSSKFNSSFRFLIGKGLALASLGLRNVNWSSKNERRRLRRLSPQRAEGRGLLVLRISQPMQDSI